MNQWDFDTFVLRVKFGQTLEQMQRETNAPFSEHDIALVKMVINGLTDEEIEKQRKGPSNFDGATRYLRELHHMSVKTGRVWAFDVDETLGEPASHGPVPLLALAELKRRGECVGLCGNLHAFMQKVPSWWDYVSFTLNFDPSHVIGGLFPKEHWLRMFVHSCRNAKEYIFVGNSVKKGTGGSDDEGACERIGFPWRFVLERDFKQEFDRLYLSNSNGGI